MAAEVRYLSAFYGRTAAPGGPAFSFQGSQPDGAVSTDGNDTQVRWRDSSCISLCVLLFVFHNGFCIDPYSNSGYIFLHVQRPCHTNI